jgi:methanogenic corrinoid protein MtbC1
VPAFVDALLAEDARAAFRVADGFLERAGSRVAVFADLFQPAMQRVAELWYQGRIGSAEEGGAAYLMAAAAERLPPTPAASPVPTQSRCLLVVPPGERHTIGLRLFTLALEDEGWAPRVVVEEDWLQVLMVLTSESTPRFVGLTAGYLASRAGLTQAVSAISCRGLPVLVGGSAFNRWPELWRQLGASGHGTDARVGVVLARRIALGPVERAAAIRPEPQGPAGRDR